MVRSGVGGGGQVVMRKADVEEKDEIGLLEGLQRSENYLIEFLCI